MDWTLLYIVAGIMLLPMFLYGLFTQSNVQSVFKKYTAFASSSNVTAAELAKSLLEKSGITDVEIQPIKGNLSDCYDPRKKVINISTGSFNNTSISALGVAAHEVGHAVQHHNKSFLFKFRIMLVPIVNFVSKLYIPLVLVGSILSFTLYIPTVGYWICWGSVIAYGASLLFYFVTLPLEFDASKKAIKLMRTTENFTETEISQAKEVLNAAAQTYVAAALTQLLYFLRFLSYAMIFTNRD